MYQNMYQKLPRFPALKYPERRPTGGPLPSLEVEPLCHSDGRMTQEILDHVALKPPFGQVRRERRPQVFRRQPRIPCLLTRPLPLGTERPPARPGFRIVEHVRTSRQGRNGIERLKRGDVITFVREIEGLGFREALERLEVSYPHGP